MRFWNSSRRGSIRSGVAASLYLVLMGCSGSVGAVPLVAISGPNTLVTFDSASPGTIRNTITVNGPFNVGETLIAVERRPLNNVLYVVTSAYRVFLVESCTGTAVQVGAGLSTDLPLIGTSLGMDFNPAADRLRFTTEAEENFRFNPVSATVVDGDGVTPGIQPDPLLNPAGNIVAAAYDRNDNDGATPTTMFVIDSGSDQLARQGGVDGVPSPNLGGITPIGALGVNAGNAAGFEIVGASEAYAMLNVGGASRLYSINLGTGAATLIGTIGANGLRGLSSIALIGIFADGFETL